jgi:hypothetical protein
MESTTCNVAFGLRRAGISRFCCFFPVEQGNLVVVFEQKRKSTCCAELDSSPAGRCDESCGNLAQGRKNTLDVFDRPPGGRRVQLHPGDKLVVRHLTDNAADIGRPDPLVSYCFL